MKYVSIIILCHNNIGISNCIKAILTQTDPLDEILIINDHSETEFLDKEIFPFQKTKNIKIYSVTQKLQNRSYNRNLGAKKSKNEILLFLDGDMILTPGSLDAFRFSHEKKGYIAFIGNSHGMRFSDIHMQLYMGRDDYNELVCSEETIRKLIDDPMLEDWRNDAFSHSNLEPYYWIYYYTCICSVERDIFLEMGGFDENLITWGSEDTDLGYRLNKYGKIGYVKDAHAFHLPHPRNLWDEQLFDRDNTRYLLDKHQTWPFELLLSFDLSADIYELVSQIRSEIITWDMPRIRPQKQKNSLWINVPNIKHTEDSVIWYNHSGEKFAMELLGIALPCCDQYFETAYVSSNIFCYPMALTSRILQECMRVSQNVILLPCHKNQRKHWEQEYLLQAREIYRTYYISSESMEYQFIPIDNGYMVVSSQIKTFLKHSRSRCPIFISAIVRQAWHKKILPSINRMVLVNLLFLDTDEIEKKLQYALGVSFEACYSFPHNNGDSVSFLSDIPIALRDIKASIFFVAYDKSMFDSQSLNYWVNPRINHDFFLGLSGDIFYLNGEAI